MKNILIALIGTVLFFSSCEETPDTIVVAQLGDQTYSPKNIKPVLEEQQRKMFSFFYDGAGTSGLALEGNQRGNVVTIGGTGFGIMNLIIGAERGWITRTQAADRVVEITRFLALAEKFNGVFSHWYNPNGMAAQFGDQIKTGDVVETGFLVAGLIAASEYFSSGDTTELEIRTSVDAIYKAIDWNFYTNGEPQLYWLWYSLESKYELPIKGWNEGWNSYLFALASPTHPISVDVYKNGWQDNGAIANPTRSYYGYPLPFGPEKGGVMFLEHYTLLGFNPSLMEDDYANYYKQAVCHTMVNRHYCLEEAPKTFLYSEGNWGLTACSGVGSEPDYKARNPLEDDGVIAPTAAIASYPYTPFYSTQVLLNLVNNHPGLQGEYGFGDSYSLKDNAYEKKHLAIDQGPMSIMIENYRTGLIWNLMAKNEYVKRALELAGVRKPVYADGFHKAISNTKTKEYDMMMHPDRECYEIDYYKTSGGETVFTVLNFDNVVIKTISVSAVAGENILTFDDVDIIKGRKYKIKFDDYEINVRLR